MPATTTSPDQDRRTATVEKLYRVSSLLGLFAVAWQGLTGGGLVPTSQQTYYDLHGTGALVAHVVTGGTAAAAVALWRLRAAPWALPVLAAVVFGLTFWVASVGGYPTMTSHVPGAVALAMGTTALVAWGFLGLRRRVSTHPPSTAPDHAEPAR